MKGKLVYKGYDHIAVRVLSLWNVSIPKSRISDEIDWESLNEGTTVQFRIHKFVITYPILLFFLNFFTNIIIH